MVFSNPDQTHTYDPACRSFKKTSLLLVASYFMQMTAVDVLWLLVGAAGFLLRSGAVRQRAL